MIIDPSFSGENYLLMKNVRNYSVRSFSVTKSPEQYNDELFTEETIRDISQYEGTIIVFDDILEYKQKSFYPICTRRRHQDLAVRFSSHPYFDLPKQQKLLTVA